MSARSNISAAVLHGFAIHAICESLQSAACSILMACTYMFSILLQGSVDHTTCEYQRLIDEAPDTIIPARPFTVHDRVYDAGDPLGGNFCPYNSSTPLQPCKKVHLTFLNCWQSVNGSNIIIVISTHYPPHAPPHRKSCHNSLFLASPVVPPRLGQKSCMMLTASSSAVLYYSVLLHDKHCCRFQGSDQRGIALRSRAQ